MKHTLLTLSLTAAALPAQFANAQPAVRYDNQQQRIAQGVSSGQLTAGETTNLERKEAAIHQEVRTDRALNGGRLTGAERAQVNRQDNHLSSQIYADKHNAAVQHYGSNEADARRYNQQQRIAGGIANHSLNASQATRLEGHEAAINKEVRGDRSLNGGRLTNGERAVVNHEQNQVSRQIYKAKHS